MRAASGCTSIPFHLVWLGSIFGKRRSKGDPTLLACHTPRGESEDQEQQNADLSSGNAMIYVDAATGDVIGCDGDTSQRRA